MLAAVQDNVSGCLTQLSFLESMVKQLPIGQQRGVRAYFADTRSHLERARKFLMEQEDWMITYCPPELPKAEQLNLADWLPESVRHSGSAVCYLAEQLRLEDLFKNKAEHTNLAQELDFEGEIPSYEDLNGE